VSASFKGYISEMRNPAKMMEILQSDSFVGSGIFHQDDSVAGSNKGGMKRRVFAEFVSDTKSGSTNTGATFKLLSLPLYMANQLPRLLNSLKV
jgi:hypothetical protein